MNNMFKSVNPTDIKVGDYLLCTTKRTNKQLIMHVSSVDAENNKMEFSYALLDDGTATGSGEAHPSDFTFKNLNHIGFIIDEVAKYAEEATSLAKFNNVLDGILNKTNKVETNRRPFNYDEYKKNPVPLVTRDGKSIRFIIDIEKGTYPLVMMIEDGNSEIPITYDHNGKAGLGNTPVPMDETDLFMVVETPKEEPVSTSTVKYARVYKRDSTGTTFMSQLVDNVSEFDNIDIPTGCSVVKIVEVAY